MRGNLIERSRTLFYEILDDTHRWLEKLLFFSMCRPCVNVSAPR